MVMVSTLIFKEKTVQSVVHFDKKNSVDGTQLFFSSSICVYPLQVLSVGSQTVLRLAISVYINRSL